MLIHRVHPLPSLFYPRAFHSLPSTSHTSLCMLCLAYLMIRPPYSPFSIFLAPSGAVLFYTAVSKLVSTHHCPSPPSSSFPLSSPHSTAGSHTSFRCCCSTLRSISLSLLHDFHTVHSIGQVLLSVLQHPHLIHTRPVFLHAACSITAVSLHSSPFSAGCLLFPTSYVILYMLSPLLTLHPMFSAPLFFLLPVPVLHVLPHTPPSPYITVHLLRFSSVPNCFP